MLRVNAIHPDTSPMRLRHCRGHLVWPLVSTQALLTSVEIVLVWRGLHSPSSSTILHAAKSELFAVQALYPNRPLYLILGSVVVAETLALAIIAAIVIPGIQYNATCEVYMPIAPIAGYGCVSPHLPRPLWRHVSDDPQLAV